MYYITQCKLSAKSLAYMDGGRRAGARNYHGVKSWQNTLGKWMDTLNQYYTNIVATKYTLFKQTYFFVVLESNNVTMLGHRLQRCPNIVPSLDNFIIPNSS